MTFNPTVQEKTLHPVHEPPKSVTLKEAADIVVRYLDPFYTQGKFATKVRDIQRLELQRFRRGKNSHTPTRSFPPFQELFKSFARYLSHLLAEGRSRGTAQGGLKKNPLKTKRNEIFSEVSNKASLSFSSPAVRSQSRGQGPHQEVLQQGAALSQRGRLEEPQSAEPPEKAGGQEVTGSREKSPGGVKAFLETLPLCQCLIRLLVRPQAALTADA